MFCVDLCACEILRNIVLTSLIICSLQSFDKHLLLLFFFFPLSLCADTDIWRWRQCGEQPRQPGLNFQEPRHVPEKKRGAR